MDVLDRLEQFMMAFRGTTVRLNPPAMPSQIDAAELVMGVALPEEVRSAYLRFNGVARERLVGDPTQPPRGPALFLPSYDWVDLDNMVEVWKIMKNLDADFRAEGIWPDVPEDELGSSNDRIRPFDWHARWIPIGFLDGAFDKVYLDLAPARAGIPGQLILIGASEGSTVIADSFTSYLTRLLDVVDSGKLIVDGEGDWRTSAGARAMRLSSAGA